MCKACFEENLLQMSEETGPTAEFLLSHEVQSRAKLVLCFTTPSSVTGTIKQEFGLVFGNSSKQAFWGLSTQADRLSRAYDAALSNLRYDAAALGANAVVGIQFALNNSTGSGAQIITGSSEAVMLLGTAVTIE